MEEKVLFQPGAVGLQLEPDFQWGSRVVRFVDGGPWDPGAARACGKIQPGDWITCVEVNGVEATTFPEMMDLLQHVQCPRTLTVRSFASTVLESSFFDFSTKSAGQESAIDDGPILVFHQDTVSSQTSLPNENGPFVEGIETEQEIKENDEGSVCHLSQTIDPTFPNDVTPHHPTKNSLHLSPCWVSSTLLHLSQHIYHVSLPLEKQSRYVIHLPPRRRNVVSLPVAVPLLFGTKLVDTYSLSIDPRLGVSVGNHPKDPSTSEDTITKLEILETPTSSDILSHQTMQLSTLHQSTLFPGMISLSSIHSCSFSNTTRKRTGQGFGTILVTSDTCPSYQWEMDQVLVMFRSRDEQAQLSRHQSDPSQSKMHYPHRNETFLDTQTYFDGQIPFRKRIGISHKTPDDQSTLRFSALPASSDQALSSMLFLIDEKEILLQKWRQPPLFPLPPKPKVPILDHNPNLETYPSPTCTQLESMHQQLQLKPTAQEIAHNTSSEIKFPTTLEEQGSSQVRGGSVLAASLPPSLTTTEPADRTESHLVDFQKRDEKQVEYDVPPGMLEATTSLQSPTSSNLLRKAKAKHQLSLARLRVKKFHQSNDAKTIDNHDKDRDSDKHSNGTETTSQSMAIPAVSGIQESYGSIPMEQSKDGHEPTTPHLPKIPPGTPFVASTPIIDFARFSQEQSLVFEPGPIGLQLDHCNTDGNDSEYPAKVVRFVDGGPQDPGPARRSGRIQPGDFVIRVEAEGVVGTTYYTILHLLQKSWTTRKITFRSAWEPLQVANSSVSRDTHKIAATPIPQRQATLRLTPLKDSAPLPYQWTPLPYDWVTKKKQQPNTPEEERALEQVYREEASRIIRERNEQKRRAQVEAKASLQQNQSSSWNFEDLVLGAVAITAESVAGCLRKQLLQGSDSEEDEGDHPKRD